MRLFSVKKIVLAGSLALPFLLSACSSAPKQAVSSDASAGTQVIKPSTFDQFLGIISPYRITIQQGNFVSEEMASQLKEGMTREQVRFILGTALLTDMFHEDRWDYPFRLQKPNGEVITSKLAIHFKNNTVEKFERGVLPTEKEYLAQITTAAVAVRNENMTPTEPQKKK
ncbi:outer membrane protein assembly factor BamE [Undibacterium cyanobacteriorum]|uniref:Outer membrane protein assembly factor BamE n=1 Tax=Undibacterium cyanobacteriorum TaxID=3073561 RepID=A0ABY9RF14_9BURK|nr:outer membrane protein assembly factor BamE [Undibacterium sp. 20NA77.5]WMW79429.1 outer membrane protein assembly factor BamE [Undibacterium sp. 20NA77.5]